MRQLLPLMAAAAIAVSPADAKPGCERSTAERIELALDAGRLHQARTMLGRRSETCGETSESRRLYGEWQLRSGNAHEALTTFLELAEEGQSANIASGAGRAALQIGDTNLALEWLMVATAFEESGWRAWNALGIALDRLEMWEESAIAYHQALSLAPEAAAIWNNLGYSLILQGKPAEALPYLRSAARIAQSDRRVRRNRTIARAMAGQYPRRSEAAGDSSEWSERLNNAGYGALLAGDRTAARSLFARAIEARESYFSRAAQNLEIVEADQ